MVDRDTLIATLSLLGFEQLPRANCDLHATEFALRGQYRTFTPIVVRFVVYQNKTHIIVRPTHGDGSPTMTMGETINSGHHGSAMRKLKDNIDKWREVYNVPR